ncbi:MAG: nucleoside hydrolase [Kiritimatiellia bacterium]|jgi:purine nucleosidase
MSATSENRSAPTKLIIDSDMLTDYDDAGAFAVAHALADRGECEILATLSCTRANGSVAVMEIINDFYGRSGIPVGCSKGMGVAGAPSGHAKFLALQEKYAGRFRHASSDDAPDAVQVYRRTLAAQPDNSVTICSIGFFTNLRRLLESAPDESSPLDGHALVAKKVKVWYAMACFYPSGHEYNSDGDAVSTRIAISGWPTPIVFCDFQYGRHLYSGRRLVESKECVGPVQDVFAAALPPREAISPRSWDQLAGHSSWDQATVLFAIRGWEPYCNLERGIYEITDDKGQCEWRYNLDARGGRVYGKLPKESVAAVIDDLMCHRPARLQ